ITVQITKNINTPLSSSLGRLFDAVAALLNFNEPITYDAQAAIALEDMALKSQDQLSYGIKFNKDESDVERLDIKSILEDVLADINRHINIHDIARRLHNTVCSYALQASIIARNQSGTKKVCLSGGVFANRLLLKEIIAALSKAGFEVYTHQSLPFNDGCLSLGQAAVAAVKWQKGDF
ncbi:MAG: carbamoyltransferase HypF, partial [Chloroflexi bacterium]|nr:carbamoyltransferase HypF [Chloroflexota bacterium]